MLYHIFAYFMRLDYMLRHVLYSVLCLRPSTGLTSESITRPVTARPMISLIPMETIVSTVVGQ